MSDSPKNPKVCSHPAGGYTIGVPLAGTASARIYVGNFALRRQAVLAIAQVGPLRRQQLRTRP